MKLFGAYENVIANSRPQWAKMFAHSTLKNEKVIALTADLSRSTSTELFRQQAPGRFFNMGIAEQNMLSVAAGLALCGKIPYCFTFAPFATMRAGEQFRQDACYMGLNVRLVGSYGGIVYPAGPTHSGLEDAGVIRSMPGSSVIAASDVNMIGKIFDASIDYNGPLYIRLGTGSKEPVLYGEDYELVIGKAIEARKGKDVTIISFGFMLQYAIAISDELAKEGIDVGILDMHTLKPLDEDAVRKAARATGRIVTMEEHNIINGLGSAVAETLMESGIPCKFKRLGIPDLFPSYGHPEKLREKYGFGHEAGITTIKDML